MPAETIAKKPYILVERPGAYAALLRLAFDQICNPNDWKDAIDAMVPWDGASVYCQAVSFMTAAPVECVHVHKDGQSWGHITSIGYRSGPAGDH